MGGPGKSSRLGIAVSLCPFVPALAGRGKCPAAARLVKHGKGAYDGIRGYSPAARETVAVRIAITGATGFLGHYVVTRFASQGHLCRCWYRPGSDRGGFGAVERQIEGVPGELGDPRAGDLFPREKCDVCATPVPSFAGDRWGLGAP